MISIKYNFFFLNCRSLLKTCELQIETFLPIERLSHTLQPENNCIMEAVAVDSGKYVVWSKFRGFLTINQCVSN